ncbi:MAG: DNA methyltransferase, partial [Persicimonas sp.]
MTTTTTTAKRPRLTIRPADALTAPERRQLEVAGLDDIAPIEAWAATGSNRQNAYATHGLFRYYGKFPPPIASHLIDEYTKTGDLVFDPMCGSGTTGVESILKSRRCELRDINPLSILVSDVKTRHLAAEDLTAALDRIAASYRPLTVDEYDHCPVGLRNPEHWFLEETSDSLRGLHRQVEAHGAKDVRRFFQVVFATTVRKVSRATTQQGRLFLDRESARKDAWPTFQDNARRAIDAVSSLATDAATNVGVDRHNLTEPLDDRYHKTVDLVVLHPPYFTNYRYSRVTSLELAWLGHDQRRVRDDEVRECFKQGDPENRHKYIDDMHRALTHAADLL